MRNEAHPSARAYEEGWRAGMVEGAAKALSYASLDDAVRDLVRIFGVRAVAAEFLGRAVAHRLNADDLHLLKEATRGR